MFREQRRFGHDPAKIIRTDTWRNPWRWNAQAESAGIRYRVFCCPWSDFFHDDVPSGWRSQAWDVIRDTPHLVWQILTKRPENFQDMLPDDWGDGYPNVALGVTIENRAAVDDRLQALIDTPARWRFLSCEPLLEAIRLPVDALESIAQVIVGGETGPGARPMERDWVLELLLDVEEAAVPFFFKQWGGPTPAAAKKAGRRLCGGHHNGQPSEWPRMTKTETETD